MEPETKYEMNGLYQWGVVFPTGNVLVNGILYVYYGASDQWCCVATASIGELLEFIRENTAKGASVNKFNFSGQHQLIDR